MLTGLSNICFKQTFIIVNITQLYFKAQLLYSSNVQTKFLNLQHLWLLHSMH